MNPIPPDLWQVMRQRLSQERQDRMQEVASQRLLPIHLVMQDVHDPHNISACLRSAEAFGIQYCHIVQQHKNFKPSGVTRGVEKWMSIAKYKTIKDCVQSLKKEGQRIYGAIPREHAVPLEALPLDQPLAVVFGNEHDGLDPEWDDLVDGFFTIPMFGMVESLNISVSCAITLQRLSTQYREQNSLGSLTSPEEQESLLNYWISRQYESWYPEYLARKNAQV